MELNEEELSELREFRTEFENDVQQKDCEEENKPRILPNDHPLLAKFQKTLNTYLLRVKNKLVDEIADLDHTLNKKAAERADLGAHLYDLQQNVAYQRSSIDKLSQQILETSHQRQLNEASMAKLSSVYDAKNYMFKEAKQRYNERLQEIDNLQIMENELSKWTKEVQDEVDVAKRIADKDGKTQQVVSDEKKRMDWFLHNLDAEVRRRENELKNINDQIDEQNCLIEDINKNLADVNADLESLYQEHKKLTNAWQEVIISIQHKDKQLSKKKSELDAEHQNQKVLQSKIEITYKAIQTEADENKKLVRFKEKIVEELQTLEKSLKKNEYEFEVLTADLEHYVSVLEQTEQDLNQANTEGLLLSNQIKGLQSTLEKQGKKKFELEEKILELLQDQITTDKARDFRSKMLRTVRDRRRNVEIAMATTENQLSQALLDLEKWRGTVDRTKIEAENLRKKYKMVDDDANKLNDEISALQNTISANQRQVEVLSKQLDAMIVAAGGQEMNPDEIKIIDLEKTIQEMDVEINNCRGFWLRMQQHVVIFSERRSQQMNDINLTRGQLLVIKQKTIKVEGQLQSLAGENKECLRNIAKLNNRLFVLNAKFADKKKLHDTCEVECEINHKEVMFKLKDAEMMIKNLEQELVDMCTEIAETKEEILSKHRETLAWETKYKLANDAKKYQDEEQSQNSEIWAMKSEIHRMEVRYGELKRAQEKLIRDLDNCVHHREHTFDMAMTNEKLVGKNLKTKSITQHKLNEMENKFKQIRAEIKKVEKALVRLQDQQNMMEQDLNGKQQKIDQEKSETDELQSKIETNMLMKQENLENIVRKQQRAKRYRELVCSTRLPKVRTDCVIHCETQRQSQINEHLCSVAENLQQEFPDEKFHLTKILQTLHN